MEPEIPAPVYVFLFAGFANRLFQVAAAMGVAARLGRPWRIVAYHHNYEHEGRNYVDFFARSISPGESHPPCLADRNIVAWFERQGQPAPHVVTDTASTFLDAPAWESLGHVPQSQAILMNGYFQNEKWFEHVADSVRQLFRAPESVAGIVASLGEAFYSQTLAVHVRLGDAKFNPMLNQPLHAYYDRCIAEARADLGGAVTRLLVVTDEPDRVLDYYPNLRTSGLTVDVLHHPDDLVEFYALSMCRGVISAKSTYSWWAAWLNPRADAWVAVPAPWAPALPDQTLWMHRARIRATS